MSESETRPSETHGEIKVSERNWNEAKWDEQSAFKDNINSYLASRPLF
ncbi:MAG: hypothetical protein WCF95_07235 [bacterium]